MGRSVGSPNSTAVIAKAMRHWVQAAEVDGVGPGTVTADAQRIAQLDVESRELPRGTVSGTVVLSRVVACVLIQTHVQRRCSGRGNLSEGGTMLPTSGSRASSRRVFKRCSEGDRYPCPTRGIVRSGTASSRELAAASPRGFDEHVWAGEQRWGSRHEPGRCAEPCPGRAAQDGSGGGPPAGPSSYSVSGWLGAAAGACFGGLRGIPVLQPVAGDQEVRHSRDHQGS